MYRISKEMEISASHNLKLSYVSPCSNLHGHNFRVIVECKAEQLNDDGMVVDFTHIKAMVHDLYDHKHLNDVLPFNPTAERWAKYIADTLNRLLEETDQSARCYKVSIEETKSNWAVWEED